MENGELSLWDPAKILVGAEYVVLSVGHSCIERTSSPVPLIR